MSACRQALRARPCGPPCRVTVWPSIRWVAAVSGRSPTMQESSPGHAVAGRGGGPDRRGCGPASSARPPAPGAAEGADRALVVLAAGSGGGVASLRPRVAVARGVRQGAERVAEALVACPAEAGDLALARLDRDRAGVPSEVPEPPGRQDARDRAVQVGEQTDRTGPEALELSLRPRAARLRARGCVRAICERRAAQGKRVRHGCSYAGLGVLEQHGAA
jgi:hypothetical protein